MKKNTITSKINDTRANKYITNTLLHKTKHTKKPCTHCILNKHDMLPYSRLLTNRIINSIHYKVLILSLITESCVIEQTQLLSG